MNEDNYYKDKRPKHQFGQKQFLDTFVIIEKYHGQIYKN
jgi:hypothetical protein